MKSNAVLNATIAVTVVAIITGMVGLVSTLFFRIQLNSPIYYGILFALTFVTIVLAAIQIWPRLLELISSRGNKLVPPPAADTESEIDELDLSEIAQEARIKLWLARNAQKNLEAKGEQNLPAKVTMEIGGTPITIESPDAAKVEDIVKLLIRDFQAPLRVISAETKIQTGIVREGKEPYQPDDPAKRSLI